MNDEEKEEHEKVFLERNREIIRTLLINCGAALDKCELDTFKKMIVHKKAFNCVMAAPGLTYQCAITVQLNPQEAKKEEEVK